MLQMIFSPSGCGKTYEIHKQISQRNNLGMRDMVLLVPEQISFETEREMLKLLGAASMDSVEVLSFSRFADKYYKKYGGRNKKCIDDIGKSAIMQLALKRLNGALSLFAKQVRSPAFADSLILFNEQMKRFCVSAQDLAKSAASKRGILAEKLTEISLIMSEYDACLNSEYYDPLDDLTKISVGLTDNKYFANRTVFLDSFNGFTAQQLPIIEKIISQANEVFIALSFDKNAAIGSLSLYDNMSKTADKIKQMAKNCGVKILPDITLSGFMRYENDEMKHIAKNAFKTDKTGFGKKPEHIHLAKLHNIYEECDFVAATIRKLTRETGLRYRDIAVISRDSQKYSGIIEQHFANYDIPCFIDAKKSAEGTAIMRFLTNALLAAKNYSSEYILAMLKTGIAFADDVDIMLLDNYINVWSIDCEDWSNEFCASPRGMGYELDDDDREILAKINGIREYIMPPLEKLHNSAMKGGVKNISAALYEFMTALQADKRLNRFCNKLSESGDNTAADVARSAYDKAISLLDQLTMALDGYDTDYRRYCDIFISAIGATNIGTLPQGLDEVAIGSAERMRPRSPKVTFIMGANEGEFPSVFSGGGIFSDRELISLKNDGLDLPCYDEQRAVDENFLAFCAMCSPSQSLYVSYYSKNDRNESNYPSAIVTELCSMFEISPQTDLLGSLEQVESRKSALSMLAAKINETSEETSILLQYFEKNPDEKFENMISSISKKKTEIEPETAKSLFGNDLCLSASRIDKFYHCSFNYFCEYGLKISPLKAAQIDSLQRGTIIHLVLCKFVEKYSPQEYFLLDKAEIAENVRSIVDDSIKDYLRSKSFDSVEQYNLDYMYRQIENMLGYIYEELLQSDYTVSDVEVSFADSDNADFEEMVVDLPNGSKARITGTIDRVDEFEKDGVKYVRVLDYKTGSNLFSLSDVLYGLNLQMLLYLSAYKKSLKKRDGIDCVPAGVLYIPVKDKQILAAQKRYVSDEEINKKRRETLKMNGIALDNPTSLRAMEPSLEGVYTPVKQKDSKIIFGDSTYSLEQFEVLSGYIENLIVNMGQKLHDGKISVNPVDGTKAACTYCNYKSICSQFSDGTPMTVAQLRNDEIFGIMEKGGTGV